LSDNPPHRVGALNLDVEFSLSQPWTVLFGPSGSGKTTLLRAIAGFVHPDDGRIQCGTNALLDWATGISIPPHSRPVRSAGQRARLFPNLTLRRNLIYGIEAAPSTAAHQLVEEVSALFRLTNLFERMPHHLSGGESQRASVARAVISAAAFPGPKPALLLLDEPFSGLDTQLRDELLHQLQIWLSHRTIPVLAVTHDIGEAFLLGAEVIKLHDGKIIAQGPVTEVLAEERQRLLNQLTLAKEQDV
jgi:molybdate transport system ATP-binding protein